MDKKHLTFDQVMDQAPDCFHHLTAMPTEVVTFWEVMGYVDSIPCEHWHNNSEPEVVARLFGHHADIIRWQSQRLTEDQMRMLRTTRSVTVIIMLIRTHQVVFRQGDMESVFDACPELFSFPQRASLSILLKKKLPTMPLSQKIAMELEHRLVKRYVFLVATGPTYQDVVSFAGDASTAQMESVMHGVTIVFCRKPRSLEKVDVSDAHKSVWFNMSYGAATEVNFLSEDYYALNMYSYSAWSHVLHSKQVAQALERVPRDVPLAAPGDALGVVARTWKGVCLSSDLYVPNESGIVRKESFETAFDRAKQHGSVLVLSYVWSLLSPELRTRVENAEFKAIIIEPKDVKPFIGCDRVGPGVFFSQISHDWFPRMSIAENAMVPAPVLYSENLLRLASIKEVYDNESVRYWKAMRPFGNVLEGPVIVHDLPELARYYREHPNSTDEIYLTSIGEVYKEFVPVSLGLTIIVEERRVYAVSARHQLSAFLMGTFHYGVMGEWLLFCQPVQKLFKKISYHVNMWKFTVLYLPRKEVLKMPTSIKLYARLEDKVWLQSFKGLEMWTVFDEFVEFLMLEYFQHQSKKWWSVLKGDVEGKSKRAYSVEPHENLWSGLAQQIWHTYEHHRSQLIMSRVCSPLGWKLPTGETVMTLCAKSGRVRLDPSWDTFCSHVISLSVFTIPPQRTAEYVQILGDWYPFKE